VLAGTGLGSESGRVTYAADYPAALALAAKTAA
jgi:hypothetical protein